MSAPPAAAKREESLDLARASKDSLEALSHDMKAILEKQAYTDVTFASPDGLLSKAHRIILAGRSTVFNAMLFGQMREAHDKETPIPVVFSGLTFRAFLHFLYSGKIAVDFNVDIIELLECANFFAVPDLLAFAGTFIVQQVTVDNCCDMLLVAIKLHAADAKKRIFEFICQNATKVLIESSSFPRLTYPCLVELFAQEQILLPPGEYEFTLFRGLLRWKQARLHGHVGTDPDHDHNRDVGVPFDLIHFNQMSSNQLTMVPGLLLDLSPSLLATVAQTMTAKQDARGQYLEFKFTAVNNMDGLINFIGREPVAGVRPPAWINPVTSGLIQVRTPAFSRGSAPLAFEQRDPGPDLRVWLQGAGVSLEFLLPAGYAFHPTQYAFNEASGDGSHVLSWVLEAKEEASDPDPWILLDTHTNDPTVATDYARYTFPVNYTGAGSFRVFRVRLTGPDRATSMFLCISRLEMWGGLRRRVDNAETRAPPRAT
eukprot:gnl/Spiro4/2629_TR1269_c0_g1_i1.p1 gnl/Spiro4/2629_TR1269_c0_g1~~gnl/Spiro4/2629_TR1269_c0_g1_i1.p1  ORF type:complete len:511 (+),score=148.20 gnl/Spiro4/2629_TR1269_c0_g1_i1:79-1533(+)